MLRSPTEKPKDLFIENKKKTTTFKLWLQLNIHVLKSFHITTNYSKWGSIYVSILYFVMSMSCYTEVMNIDGTNIVSERPVAQMIVSRKLQMNLPLACLVGCFFFLFKLGNMWGNYLLLQVAACMLQIWWDRPQTHTTLSTVSVAEIRNAQFFSVSNHIYTAFICQMLVSKDT